MKERTLAEISLKEIQAAKERLKALAPKIRWIEQIKRSPKEAANLYFEIFDHFIQYYGRNDEYWEKFSLLLHFGAKPLSVKNQEGLNPLEYFYKKNREKRQSLNDNEKAYTFHSAQQDHGLIYVANSLYNTFKDLGYNKKQLSPIIKVQILWDNFEHFIAKQSDTRRATFYRLLKTVERHPEDAPTSEALKQKVKAQLKQEAKDEKKALKAWREWEKEDFRARFHLPEPGHARGHSTLFNGMHSLFNDESFLKRPLPDSSQEALDDFLLSLKDEDAIRGLKFKSILSPKRIKAYQRSLNPPKKFERTR